ncbi:hypothetical protein [Nonomuraea typhae]|uniref:Uncharacterized protein n=1 Tax=Nonomuraea typhae TaxID=2603600 RepID=A0ABW7Z6Z3_9ACTN
MRDFIDEHQAVTVLIDPRDTATITQQALLGHDRDGGRITVHPTPATHSLIALAHDLLTALGKRYGPDAEAKQVARAWRQVTAWVCAYRIAQIVVLRTHLLSRPALARLVQLTSETGAALCLVWHARPPADWREILPASTVLVLEDVERAVAQIRARRVLRAEPQAQPLYCPSLQADPEQVHRAVEQPLPALPVSDITRFRADAYRQLGPEDFAAADTLYRYGMDAACAFLTAHPDYHARPTPARADVDADLTTSRAQGGDSPIVYYPFSWRDRIALINHLLAVVTASPSHRHTLAILRGVQAGFLRHGLLLTLPPNPATYTGAGFGPVPFTSEAAELIRLHLSNPVRAACLAASLFTTLPAASLGHVKVTDLSADTTQLAVHGFSRGRQWRPFIFPVPRPARDLLEAARFFWYATPLATEQPLLTEQPRIGVYELEHDAAQCNLDPSFARQRISWESIWPMRTRCLWVADPIHDNLHYSPGRQVGAHVPHA